MKNFNFKKFCYILFWVLIVVVVYIILIFGAYGLCLFADYIKDKDNSNIVLNDDNYNKNYFIDSNGNLHSQNLIDIPNPTTLRSSDSDSYEFYVNINSGYFTFNFDLTNFSNITISFYMLNSDNEQEEYNIYSLPYTFYSLSSQEICLSFSNLEDNIVYTLSNVMLVPGQIAIPYEPYGAIYYSSSNYDDLNNEYNNVLRQLEDLDDEYNNLLDGVYSSNPFYNASVSYYYSLNSSNYAWIRTLDNDFLQYSNQFDIVSFLKYYLSSQLQQDFYDDQGIGYFKIAFDKPFLASNLTWLVVGTYPFQFDYYFTFYFDDNTSYIYHNELSSNQYFSFNIDLSNTSYASKNVSYITFRRGASDMITSLSNNQYSIGYNDGYMNGYGVSEDKYNSIVNEQKSTIEDLNARIDFLEDEVSNSLNGLAFSMVSGVMSTPFNILHDMLNFDFFGINLFGLFTSLLTFLIIVWIIKFLLGRK